MTGWSDLPSELKLVVAEHCLQLALNTGTVSWMHDPNKEATNFVVAWNMQIPAVNDLLSLLSVAPEIKDEIIKLAQEELQARAASQKAEQERAYELWDGTMKNADREVVEKMHTLRREMTILELLLTKLGADDLYGSDSDCD